MAGLPFLFLAGAGLGLGLAPFLLALSRWLETRADTFSIQLTANPEAFIQAMTKLHRQNLAEERPSRWVEILFYDHPPLYRRLALAQRCQARRPG